MEWQAIVFTLQILLLAASWVLFQRARAELSANAAEMPVLSEVQALQRSVKQLLTEMETASDRSSSLLETRCREARELLNALEQKAEAAQSVLPSAPKLPKRVRRPKIPAMGGWMSGPETTAQAVVEQVIIEKQERRDAPQPAAPNGYEVRRQTVFALADSGEPAAVIAKRTGISEGEIETLLGLRRQK